jgi:hypothetical protein
MVGDTSPTELSKMHRELKKSARANNAPISASQNICFAESGRAYTTNFETFMTSNYTRGQIAEVDHAKL